MESQFVSICKSAHRTVCKKQNVFVLKQAQSILARLDGMTKCMYHSDPCVPVWVVSSSLKPLDTRIRLL
jgi:hypothetical protein